MRDTTRLCHYSEVRRKWPFLPDYNKWLDKYYEEMGNLSGSFEHTNLQHIAYQTFLAYFQKLIGQKLTNKTQGIWYPPLEKEENFLMRWIEDEES